MKTVLHSIASGKSISKKIFSFLLSFFLGSFVFAGVIVTPATCSTGISADKAANAFQPGFTQLNDMTVKEGKPNDFADSHGRLKTLILSAPLGWTFKPASGSIVLNSAKDFSSLSMKVSRKTITIRFIVNGTAHIDAFSIAGIEVQATDGASIDCQGSIFRASDHPGTAIVHGIKTSCIANGSLGTGFGFVSQISGTAAKLVFAATPGQAIAGTMFEQQPVIITQDQFGNPTTNGLETNQDVRLRLSSGTGSLQGTIVLNIGTAGGNGIVNCSDLRINASGAKKLMAISGALTFAVTNEFTIIEEETTTTSTEDNPDWICLL